MDSFYTTDLGSQGSLRSRSRANSHLSSTAVQFQGLNIDATATPPNDHHQRGPSSETITTAATTHHTLLDLESQQPTGNNFISAPVPQYTAFPQLPQSDLDANWSYSSAKEEFSRATPVLGLNLGQAYLADQSIGNRSSPCPSNPDSATMSAIGIQPYDAQFDAGTRTPYNWAQFELEQQFMPQDMSRSRSPGTLMAYEDSKLMMHMYGRSVSASPPHGNLTPEQRELKRQRDHARRDSKRSMRRDRSTSSPYNTPRRTSPNLMSRPSSEYVNALGQGALLPHDSPSLVNANYLAPFSPQVSDSGMSEMYGPVFSLGPNEFPSLPVYAVPFTTDVVESGLQAFAPRPHSLSLSSVSDQPHMYHNHQNPELSSTESPDHVRVVHSRPKPQCWEHGCNGRQFSTFSNLLRHQREKSGAATKSSCPHCGAEFTRTTARNGHMAHEKCKQRRNS